MTQDKSEMSFWSHLGALRTVVVRIAVVYLLAVMVAFCFMRQVFNEVILAPCRGDFPLYRLLEGISGDGNFAPDFSNAAGFHVEIINIELASQFFIHMSSSFWLALVVCFPYIIYQLWTFVAPGLYEHEKRGIRKAFGFGNLMFYLGILVGYFVVFPMALRFLADYHLSDEIANTVSLTSYMDSFYMLTLMMGVVFELPLVAWLLGKIGVLKRSFFGRYRKYAFVAILILSSIITPTSDLVTLFVVFIPVYTLWEASALLVPRSAQETRDQRQETRDKRPEPIKQ